MGNLRIVQPHARMMPPVGSSDTEFTLTDGVELLKRVEWCARISHRSEDAVTEDSCKRFIDSVVLQHGDWSVTEHASISVDFSIDRGVSHELVRHRLFSFTQESTRFVNYQKRLGLSFVSADPESEEHPAWTRAIEASEASYKELLLDGWAPQLARSVLPNALATRLIATANLRAWRHFLLMRTSKESHPQMRRVTVPLLDQFRSKIPILYRDIEPGTSQAENLKKPQ